MIKLKSPENIAAMQRAGRLAGEVREAVKAYAKVGMTTRELDLYARKIIKKGGAEPSFLGYNGYPANICISVNEEVVHGIPGDRVLMDGDLVSIDIGTYLGGFHGDTADSFVVGKANPEAEDLIAATRESFFVGLELCVPGNKIGDIGHAIQEYVEDHGYSVVRALTGHGIGRKLHEDPAVPNYGRKHTGDVLRPGMTIAIEPMVNAGTHRVYVLDNDWTIVSADGRLSAHYEHTVAITEGAPLILTKCD
ncbi:type I methionyl aminopeptidase [Christensenella sp. MSJ-20]|uniref:type I methionyl aminopeptidase n=1 Tax=Christensenella sp. MSJ-20 TaxID=2841518 RepID=UPI000D7964BA|nr:MAG: type I methionyl aminopeptidase [Bacillota bacterium]QWT55134.1 type I methionyl aminopeptidase [Christensenella sp. MSJ-20]